MRVRPSFLTLALLAALVLAPAAAHASPDPTHWLCKPGLANNPCDVGLDTTVASPAGQPLSVKHVEPVSPRPFDCFYVYPTVSDEKAPAASFDVRPELRSIALYQTARYRRYCRVFAPVYRQITIQGLFAPGSVTPALRRRALDDVIHAWRNYLSRYNDGRGVVLIGHSQGSFVLRQLMAQEIDPHPSVRAKLISALLMGGNVLVKKGQDVGGDFQHIPACRAPKQFGCVVAFSTYDAVPPSDSLFGRSADASTEVLCTNPAALGGGAGLADPIFPTAPFAPSVIGSVTTSVGVPHPSVSTPWITFPGAYKAHCSSKNGANVLQVAPRGGAPLLKAIPDATWGLHLVDANIELGNEVALVRSQATAWGAP